MPRFPALEPYETGLLDVGDGHRTYWEVSGSPAGTPVLILHGGPGSGSTGGRRTWDEAKYRAWPGAELHIVGEVGHRGGPRAGELMGAAAARFVDAP